MVKSARWPHRGTWIQHRDCIENRTPEDATLTEMLSARAGETYTSMVTRERFHAPFGVRIRASFESRMAPSIVLAHSIGADAAHYPEYREHVEIVLFDRGINVWRHHYANGKPGWRKLAGHRCRLAAGQPHDLRVTVESTDDGTALDIRCGTERFRVANIDLPANLHAGVTGCEGRNRFYGFEVHPR